jgi:hypothetical protein
MSERHDGRRPDQGRAITIETGVSPYAEGSCIIATGACIDTWPKTWLVATVIAAGGVGGSGGAGAIEAVPLLPPQDDNNRIEKYESTDRKLVNRPYMSCPCFNGSESSIAPFGANSQ